MELLGDHDGPYRELGGNGGGGAGADTNGASPTNGTVNKGGGAGGSSGGQGSPGAQGGSGVVIARYSGSQQATGGTITSSGGYTIHTFNSSGTFTTAQSAVKATGGTITYAAPDKKS